MQVKGSIYATYGINVGGIIGYLNGDAAVDKGAYAYMPAKDEMFFEPAKKVQVVSTVGAGDSFGAVFVAQYLSGTDLQVCLKMASEYSAYVVSKQDAIPN